MRHQNQQVRTGYRLAVAFTKSIYCLEKGEAGTKVSTVLVLLFIHLILVIYRMSTATLDEYARYCLLSQHYDFEDVRRWWMEERQKRDFPNLSRMALDILSIPAMAADPERLFFSAGLTVTDRRNYLLIESIKDLECIKS